jgi:hypothetical protein
VLFDWRGEGAWLDNEALLPEEPDGAADLALLGRVLRLLRAERVEHDGHDLVVIGGELPVEALDTLRTLLGERLLECSLRPEGVHQIGTRLRLAREDS